MADNIKRDSVKCIPGSWLINVTVQGGTGDSALIPVSQNECEPEPEEKSKPIDLLRKLLSLVPKLPVGPPPPIPLPRVGVPPIPLPWP